ncbi:hypothetical protein ACFQY4_21475 [Catellatospora bangladeshensis]|uniref:Pectate lyase n=1 Tax=Catellatospora bangladeshensis TaxID=310355 RepID=A0A8J3NLT3_9ACTN|nr:hypothetical protein [Catellatospora bangladeshensis]GIF84358.1 hypothetical protein Cba03nite_57070 [Catellatospora bangladeshensis]
MQSSILRRALTGVALSAALSAPAALAGAAPALVMAESQETEGPKPPPIKGFAAGDSTGDDDTADADRRIIVYN